jgi:hypothetical protein
VPVVYEQQGQHCWLIFYVLSKIVTIQFNGARNGEKLNFRQDTAAKNRSRYGNLPCRNGIYRFASNLNLLKISLISMLCRIAYNSAASMPPDAQPGQVRCFNLGILPLEPESASRPLIGTCLREY